MTERLGPPLDRVGRARSGPSTSFSPAATIADRMVQLTHQYTGRGPTKARTTLNTNLVVVLFQDTLTKGEQNLVAAGQLEAVHSMRRTFSEVMGPEAIALVGDVLQREVVAFMSDMDPKANVAVMVFVLEPQFETGRAEVADAAIDASHPAAASADDRGRPADGHPGADTRL